MLEEERTYSKKDIKRVLITEKQIQYRIRKLAEQISRDYASVRRMLMVPIYKGAGTFFSDLNREIDHSIPRVQDFTVLSSYDGRTVSSGNVKTILDLKMDIEGEDVLVVEDILDTGRTLSALVDHLSRRHPKSLKLCVLLDKPARRASGLEQFKADYTGFTIEDHFVVGYGLDIHEYLRNLPYVGILKPEVPK
ncbi:MAG: hypoxanthine phosphoribosyltransferase [Candidatus Woesearchaeota archaeon]